MLGAIVEMESQALYFILSSKYRTHKLNQSYVSYFVIYYLSNESGSTQIELFN